MRDVKYVAIVDDHTLFRKGLASLIGLFPGYEVLFDAANGKDLMNKLDSGDLPDILLLDITMPEMDGYETASWVRQNFPEVRMLALSTMDAEIAIIRMITCGVKGYILKDADTAELKKAFDDVLTLGYYYNDFVSRKIVQSINQLTDSNSTVHAVSKLSDREMTFLRLSCSEKTYLEIAAEMILSERTVDGYREALFKKFNVSSRVGLVLFAVRNGLIKI